MSASRKDAFEKQLLELCSSFASFTAMAQRAACANSERISSEEEIASAATSNAVPLEANPDIQMRGVEGKGRGLFWCPSDGRTLRKGTTLLRLQPEMMVPDDIHVKTCCHTCYANKAKDGGPLQRCSDCKLVRYCSDACKVEDRYLHEKECKALVAFGPLYSTISEKVEDPGSNVRLMARLLWQSKLNGKEWWKKIETLLVHPDKSRNVSALLASYDSSKETPEHLFTTLKLADYLNGQHPTPFMDRDVMLAGSGYPNIQELGDLYARIKYTNLNSAGWDQQGVGTALSTVAGMINHSCVANSVVVYPRGAGVKDPLHVVNLKDLKAGDEITIVYREECDPYAMRQASLQNDYFFQCRCPLCLKDESALEGKIARVDPREATWCGRSDCDGWVAIDWKEEKPKGLCTGCKQPSVLDAEKVKDILAQAKALLHQVESDRCPSRTEEVVLASRSLLRELTAIQPPSSYPLLGILGYFSNPLGSLSRRAKLGGNVVGSIKYSEEQLRFYLSVCAGWLAGEDDGMVPTGHPARAMLMTRIAKLLLKLPDEVEAKWMAANASESLFLNRMPALPPPGAARIESGLMIATQAIEEILIGFGDDAKDCAIYNHMMLCILQWRKE